jgi:TatD DNase family protein
MAGLFIDIHTHAPVEGPGLLTVTNLLVRSVPFEIPERGLFSFGIHPWDSETVSFNRDAFRLAAGDPRCVAIGECGIDRLRGAAVRSQELLFRSHANLAEESAKPLIIHCVRAWEEIIALKRELQPGVPWIIHGFRGRIPVAKRLLDQGFFLSFGESILSFNRILSEILRSTPEDRFFLESDDGRRKIPEIYEGAVKIKNLSLEDLQNRLRLNFEKVFGLHGTS